MNCPNCGYVTEAGALDCRRCGVIFAKWAKRAAAPPSEGPIQNDAPSSPPRFTLKVLIPWSAERSEYVHGLWSWALHRFFGINVPRITPALVEGSKPSWDRLVPVMRIWASLSCGGVAAALVISEGFHLSLGVALALVGLLWLPWRPARMLAAVLLVPIWISVSQLALIIAVVGGPDGRGSGSALAVPLGSLALTVLGALLGLVIFEFRSLKDPAHGMDDTRA